MTDETLSERQLILLMAMQECLKKRDECESDRSELDRKLNVTKTNGQSSHEDTKVLESMLYLKSCRDGWQESVDHIKEWQKELEALSRVGD